MTLSISCLLISLLVTPSSDLDCRKSSQYFPGEMSQHSSERFRQGKVGETNCNESQFESVGEI